MPHTFWALPFTQASSGSNLWSPAANSPYPGGQFGGFTVYNTSTTNGVQIEFWDNATAASGVLLGALALQPFATSNALSSTTVFYGDHGIRFRYGIYVNVIGTSPAIKGSVFYA